ncbi:MAPEG family protein [Paracoccus pacificus]|uniref:MAPEG family protein n=1 Tax=Paracoccus pacificus TaxID=1463598 RepID=A0ABW4R6W8_9RHOB
MTTELTVLALAALLQLIQIGLAAAVMNKDVGADWNAGPRDTQPEFSPMTGRLRRAVDNHFEGLLLFTIAVVVVVLSNSQSWLTATCAWVYLLARIAYVPAYAFGLSPWRSVIWGVGTLATVIMLLAGLF